MCMGRHDERKCARYKALRNSRLRQTNVAKPISALASEGSIAAAIGREQRAQEAAEAANYKEFCGFFFNHKKCRFGDRCKYFHYTGA